jgi:hypothetical protein
MTQTSTGTLFAISASSPATIDAAGFQALTYTNVAEITDVPEMGGDTAVVTHMPLATGVVEKFKGFVNFGSVTLGFADDITDAGQLLLDSGATGANKNLQHSARVTLQDGTFIFFTNKIFSFKLSPGSADAIVSATSLIEIESKLVRV